MLVSLCGPSSLLTSTLVPTLTLATLVPIEDRNDGEETARYFAHHVGCVMPTRVASFDFGSSSITFETWIGPS